MPDNGSASPLSRAVRRSTITSGAEAAFLGQTPADPPVIDTAAKRSGINPELAALVAEKSKPVMGQRMYHTRLDDDLFEALNRLKAKGVDKTTVVNKALRAYLNIST